MSRNDATPDMMQLSNFIKIKELLGWTHLKAIDSRMARTRWLFVVDGFRPMKEAQALGSLSGAFGGK